MANQTRLTTEQHNKMAEERRLQKQAYRHKIQAEKDAAALDRQDLHNKGLLNRQNAADEAAMARIQAEIDADRELAQMRGRGTDPNDSVKNKIDLFKAMAGQRKNQGDPLGMGSGPSGTGFDIATDENGIGKVANVQTPLTMDAVNKAYNSLIGTPQAQVRQQVGGGPRTMITSAVDAEGRPVDASGYKGNLGARQSVFRKFSDAPTNMFGGGMRAAPPINSIINKTGYSDGQLIPNSAFRRQEIKPVILDDGLVTARGRGGLMPRGGKPAMPARPAQSKQNPGLIRARGRGGATPTGDNASRRFGTNAARPAMQPPAEVTPPGFFEDINKSIVSPFTRYLKKTAPNRRGTQNVTRGSSLFANRTKKQGDSY